MTFDTPIKAMLFDLDGTLVKLPLIWEFFDDLLVEALTEFNIKVPPQETRLALWHTGGEFESVLQSWGVEDYPSFIHHFDVLDLEKRQRMIKSGEVRLFDDVEVLAPLQERFSLGLLTNTPPDIAWLEVKSFDLEKFFEVFVMLGTVEQEKAKPEPEGFLRCLKKLNALPEEAVMVGDSSSDIIGGNRVGMVTVLIDRPNQDTPNNLQPPPDLTITDLHDLLKFQKFQG